MSQEIVDAVREIEREKGIETGTLVAALEDALLAAYKKTPGAARHAAVELDDLGVFRVFAIDLPGDLDAAAKKANMKFGHVAAMDSKGLTPEGTPAEVPSDPEFLAAVFKADAGADNDPVSAKSGAYYVVRVNGTTPPKLKPLEQVRADATAQWLAR